MNQVTGSNGNSHEKNTLTKEKSTLARFLEIIPSSETLSRTFSVAGLMIPGHGDNLPYSLYSRPELMPFPALNLDNFAALPVVEEKEKEKEEEPVAQVFESKINREESQPSDEDNHSISTIEDCDDDNFIVAEPKKQKTCVDIGATPEKMRGDPHLFDTPEQMKPVSQKRSAPFDGLRRNLSHILGVSDGVVEVKQQNKVIDGRYALPVSNIMDFFDVFLNGNDESNHYKMKFEACYDNVEKRNETTSPEPTSIKLKIVNQYDFSNQDLELMRQSLIDVLRHHLGENEFDSLYRSHGGKPGSYYFIEFNPDALCKLTNELDALPNKIRQEDPNVRNQRIQTIIVESKLVEMRHALEADHCPFTEDFLTMYKIRASFDIAFNYDKDFRLALTTNPNLKLNMKTGLFDAEQRYACFSLYIKRNPDLEDAIVSIFPGIGDSEKCTEFMAYCFENNYSDLVGAIETIYSFHGDEIGG